jgi:hypothetical protein
MTRWYDNIVVAGNGTEISARRRREAMLVELTLYDPWSVKEPAVRSVWVNADQIGLLEPSKRSLAGRTPEGVVYAVPEQEVEVTRVLLCGLSDRPLDVIEPPEEIVRITLSVEAALHYVRAEAPDKAPIPALLGRDEARQAAGEREWALMARLEEADRLVTARYATGATRDDDPF